MPLRGVTRLGTRRDRGGEGGNRFHQLLAFARSVCERSSSTNRMRAAGRLSANSVVRRDSLSGGCLSSWLQQASRTARASHRAWLPRATRNTGSGASPRKKQRSIRGRIIRRISAPTDGPRASLIIPSLSLSLSPAFQQERSHRLSRTVNSCG